MRRLPYAAARLRSRLEVDMDFKIYEKDKDGNLKFRALVTGDYSHIGEFFEMILNHLSHGKHGPEISGFTFEVKE